MPEESQPAAGGAAAPRPRVLLVGWGTANWRLLQPLMDAGELPHLSRLVERGVMGKISTRSPALPPLLWTSVATGVTPDRHGILGPLEPDEVSGGVRPAGSGTRQVSALWNMLDRLGKRSVVVNWPAGHPAEPVLGAVVSNRFPYSGRGANQDVPAASVHPPELAPALAQLRIGADDLTGDDLALFIPRLHQIDQARDRRPAALAAALAANVTVHAAATWLMESQAWDFCAVYYDLIEQAASMFLPFHARAAGRRPPDDAEPYREVMAGVCRYMDIMLGRLLHLAGPETAVILLSGRGIRLDRPLVESRGKDAPEAPVRVHPSRGILCMAGPGIRHDELIHGAVLLDVAPTVLALLGLPAGSDMPGRILAEAFQRPPTPQVIPSWGSPAAQRGHSEAAEDDAWDSAEALRQLAELGYADPRAEASQAAWRDAQNRNDFTLAQVFLAQHRPAEALPLLERVAQSPPEAEIDCRLFLAQCYFELGRRDDCRALAETLSGEDRNRAAAALLLANLCLAEGRLDEGMALLHQAQLAPRPAPAIQHLIGTFLARQGRWDEAATAFQSMLQTVRDFAPAWCGLAQARLAQRQCLAAAAAALEAVRLQFRYPEAHATLGLALAQMGQYARAAQAFRTCLALRPGVRDAEAGLAFLRSIQARGAAGVA